MYLYEFLYENSNVLVHMASIKNKIGKNGKILVDKSFRDCCIKKQRYMRDKIRCSMLLINSNDILLLGDS